MQCHVMVGKIYLTFQFIVYHILFPNIYLPKWYLQHRIR